MLSGLALDSAGLIGLIVAGAGPSYPFLIIPVIVAGFGTARPMPAGIEAPGRVSW